MVSGSAITRATSARYLGIYLEVSAKFKCLFATNKANFFKVCNSIFGKVRRNASEVLFALIKSKCWPILFYDIEGCPINSTVRRSLEFTMNKILFRIFDALSTDSFRYVCECFGIDPLEQLIQERHFWHKSLSSLMMWNLQSYPWTWHFFEGGGGQNILWPLLHVIRGSRPPNPQDIRPCTRF